jgi:hypothetical protein
MDLPKTLKAIDGRLEDMQIRMERLELALNRLLKLFGMESEAQEHGTNDVTAVTTVAGTTNDVSVLEGQSEDGIAGTFLDEMTIQHELDANTDGGFKYEPLIFAKSEIRVLALYSSDTPSEPIIAELHTQSLDDESYGTTFKLYAALSYTWGAPIFDNSIQVNGSTFAVTRNLEAALRTMRNRKDPMSMSTSWAPNNAGKTPIYFWVDQICINQQDVDERNEQIALMRRIYKRASSVQVWLGEEADDSGIAMNLLSILGAPPMRAPGQKELSYPPVTTEEVKRNWAALQALFNRPWWVVSSVIETPLKHR